MDGHFGLVVIIMFPAVITSVRNCETTVAEAANIPHILFLIRAKHDGPEQRLACSGESYRVPNGTCHCMRGLVLASTSIPQCLDLNASIPLPAITDWVSPSGFARDVNESALFEPNLRLE